MTEFHDAELLPRDVHPIIVTLVDPVAAELMQPNTDEIAAELSKVKVLLIVLVTPTVKATVLLLTTVATDTVFDIVLVDDVHVVDLVDVPPILAVQEALTRPKLTPAIVTDEPPVLGPLLGLVPDRITVSTLIPRVNVNTEDDDNENAEVTTTASN